MIQGIHFMRTNIIMGFGIGLAIAMTLASTVSLADDQAKTDEALIGDYTFESVQIGDESVPLEKLKAARIHIGKDEITIMTPGGESVVEYHLASSEGDQPARIMLEVTASPKKDRIGVHATGLIMKQGNTVQLIYDLQKDRSPDDFKPDGPQQHLIVMKAEKP